MWSLHKIFGIFVVLNSTLNNFQNYFNDIIAQKQQINDDILMINQRRKKNWIEKNYFQIIF